MKISELMLGDWVYSYNHEKCKVCQINGIGTPTVELDSYDNDDGCFILDCEPMGIPITKEILEKNDFEGMPYAFLKLDRNSWLEYYYHEHRLRKYWQGIDEWNNHAEVKELTFQCGCHYVHELQHALRLCGIDKNIEL